MTSPVLVPLEKAGPNDAFSIGWHAVLYSGLDADTNHLQSNFYLGYQDLYNILLKQEKFNPSDPRMYWLQNAIEINSNNAVQNPSDPQGLSNTFIRSVTANGLLYEGKASEDTVDQMVQTNSDTIGKYVLGAIDGYPKGDTSQPLNASSQIGVIPGIDDFIQNDIGSALEKGNQSIQGWGGAFYFWNTPIVSGSSDTIGSQIYGSESAYQEFLTINAKALLETVGAAIQQSATSRWNSVLSTFNALITYGKSQTPGNVDVDILSEVLDLIENGYDYPHAAPEEQRSVNRSQVLTSSAASGSDIQSTQVSSQDPDLGVLSGVQMVENASLTLDVLPTTTTVLTSGVNAPNALNGTVSIVDGKLVYTPHPDFVGSDLVSFTTTDGTSIFTSIVPVTVTGVAHDTVTENADGSTTTLHFDATGTPTASRTLRTDGSYDLTTYSTAGGQSYASSMQSYDAQGVLLSTTSFYVDGSTYLKAVPVTNADGSTGTDVYDRSGTLIQQTIVRADGTKEVIQNLSVAKPYTTIETFYDSAGRLTSEVFLNADGSTDQTGSVALNADGSSVETFTTPAGVVLGQKVTNTDGTSDVGLLGIVHQPWTSTSSHYDASGQLISKRLLQADGSVYLQGTAVQGPLGTTVTYAAPSGSLSAVETIDSDGSSTIAVSNISGQSYISKTSAYEASGRLTTETFGNADGSQDVNQYSWIGSGGPYVASVIHYDPTGLLQSESDYSQSGSLIESQYTIQNDDDSTTTTFEDADGKVYEVALTGGGVTTDTFYDDTGAAVSVQVSVDPGASYTGSADRLLVSAHWNATITLTGSLSEVDGSGSGATVNLAGTDETVFINSATINLWNAASATVNGDGNTVVLNDDDTVTVLGMGNTATLQGTGNSLAIASATIDVFNDAAGTITGDGNTLAVYAGADITVEGDGTTATFYDANSSVTMIGADADAEVASTGETIAMTAGTARFWNGTSATVTGDGNTVVLNNDDTVTVSGTGNTATLQGTGNSLAIASATINVFNDAAGTITGDGNTLAVYARADVTVEGDGTTATFYDANSSVTMIGADADAEVASTGETIAMTAGTARFWNGTSATVTGDGNTVVLNNDDTVTVSGTGNTATLQGTGNSLAIASATIDVFNDAAGTVTGDGNTLALYAGTDVTVEGDGTTVTFYDANSSVTMIGAGADAEVASTGETIAMASGTAHFWNGTSAIVTGDGNTVVLNNDDTVTVLGTGNTATLQGTGNSLAIASGQVVLTNGAAAAVTGNGNTMTLLDGVSLTASGTNDSFVFTAAPATATIRGYDATDTVQFSASTFADWHSLLSHASQQGADTMIQTDATHSVTLAGVALSSLNQSHFRFV